MIELPPLYTKLLLFGLLSIRDALNEKDIEWAKAEAEFLHNIPSLIDEPNVKRHDYFWFCERVAYIEWVSASGGDKPRKRLKMFYEPIWQEMEPIVADLLSAARAAT